MATVTKDAYLRLLESRPFKFDGEEVNFRKGDAEHQCAGCVHFFERSVDSFKVCEVYRPPDDDSVIANGVCDFWSEDNESHPLLEE